MRNVYWRELRKNRYVYDKGSSFTTEKGEVIYWYRSEEIEARVFLDLRATETLALKKECSIKT